MCSSRSIGISYETTIAPRQRVSRTVLYPTHNDCQVLRLLGKASLAASSCCSISDRASDAAVGIQPLGRRAGVWLSIHWAISPLRQGEVVCIPDTARTSTVAIQVVVSGCLSTPSSPAPTFIVASATLPHTWLCEKRSETTSPLAASLLRLVAARRRKFRVRNLR